MALVLRFVDFNRNRGVAVWLLGSCPGENGIPSDGYRGSSDFYGIFVGKFCRAAGREERNRSGSGKMYRNRNR